jgi:hypothetical protein
VAIYLRKATLRKKIYLISEVIVHLDGEHVLEQSSSCLGGREGEGEGKRLRERERERMPVLLGLFPFYSTWAPSMG